MLSARQRQKGLGREKPNHLTHRRKVMIARIAKRMGASYLWGVANFTAGVVAGGIYVAVALIAAGLIR
jgi:hypothetical protein